MSHRRPKRLAAAAFCLAAAASFAHAQGKPDLTRAAQAYLAGARALDRRDFAAAQTAFAQATALDPARADYNRALTATRDHRIADLIQQAARARITGSDPRADALLAEARLIDPTNELVLQHPVELPAIPVAPTPSRLEFAAPIKEQPLGLTTDLHLNGDVKQIVTQASRTFGLKVVFDESVTAQSLRFDLPETTYTQGFPLLLKTAGLFAVPVDTKTLLIAKDTQENRQKFERLVEETIYVPGRTPEQLNELTNIVKNVFDVKQAIVSAALNTLVLRAPEPTLRAVNATLDDLLLGDPQVVLELKLITIDKSRTLNTGANTPTSVGAFSLAAEAQSLVTANQSILQQAIASGALTLPTTLSAAQLLLLEALFLVRSGLATDANVSGLVAILGGGLTTLGISAIGSAGFNFALNTSDSRALDDITVRVGDRQTTTLRVGEKYPITTSTYTSGLSSSTTAAIAGATINGVSVSSLLASASSAVIPIIQYEDLGITLKTAPFVLKSGLIALHIDLKIEALTGASLDNIPILTSRNFVSDITVPDGSSAIMLSDLSRTEESSISGIPGLAELPGLQQSAADTLRERDSSELVLQVTPHLVQRRPNIVAGPRIAFSTSVPQDY